MVCRKKPLTLRDASWGIMYEVRNKGETKKGTNKKNTVKCIQIRDTTYIMGAGNELTLYPREIKVLEGKRVGTRIK